VSRRMTTVRVARWSATHPWRAIGAWVLFVAVCVWAGGAVGTRQSTSEDILKGEVLHAQQIVDDGHFGDPAVENILITATSGRLDPARAAAAAADAARRLRVLPQVAAVGAPVTAPDRGAVLVPVTMRAKADNAAGDVPPLLGATAAVQAAHADVRVEEVGAASLTKALDDTLGGDFKKAEMVSIPVTLAILLLAFGALIAAGVPVLLALSAVFAAMGLSALTSHLIPANDIVSSMVLLMGLAVGVDYSLFYVRREREERAAGRTHIDAVEIAAATSGHAVVVSGLAVIVSMAGMYMTGDQQFTAIATGCILVVAVAVIGSLTVLPAMLAKLGRWVDRPRIPFVWRLTARSAGRPRFWSAVLRPALRRPVATLVIAVAALAALAVPAFAMKLKLTSEADLPRSIPIMQSYDRMTAAFPSTGATHLVAVRAPAAELPEVRAALADLYRRTAADDRFAHDRMPQLRTSADGRVTTMEIGVRGVSDSPAAYATLDELRQSLVPATLGTVPGADYAVGGWIAGGKDFNDTMQRSLLPVVGFVLALTFLVMLLTFRSVVVALTAIALNTLSVGAAYGVLVLTFQHHWAEGLLGFHSNGGVVAWLPLLLFVILFGLSMDYHVFVVSRIREAARRGVPTRQAVAQGITGSAGTVTSAAVVMVAVFSIFATLSTLDMKQMGVGLAVAILVDATIIRAVVLPAVMTLLGPANWWAPRFLRPRREPELSLPATQSDRQLTPVG
jgi:putative drug exporter of the RND superfamily